MASGLQISRSREGVLLLVLDRPEVLNAIDITLFEALDGALADAAVADAVRTVVITGSGDRAFSSGFDIHEMASFDGEAMAAAFSLRDPLFWRIASHPKPIVAALNGVSYGAGALIAAAADIRLGCPRTRFKITASSYGAANATWSLPRIVGMAKAKEILFTGRLVLAEEALAIGLLNAMADSERLLEAALDMAAAIAANPPQGIMGAKALMNAALGRPLQEAYRAEFEWMRARMAHAPAAGETVFGAFLEKDRTGD